MRKWAALAFTVALSAPATAKEDDCHVRVYDADRLARSLKPIVRRIQRE
ncbi:hypothetical protein ACNHKD_11445 [Methylocystis sp. JAN1]